MGLKLESTASDAGCTTTGMVGLGSMCSIYRVGSTGVLFLPRHFLLCRWVVTCFPSRPPLIGWV